MSVKLKGRTWSGKSLHEKYGVVNQVAGFFITTTSALKTRKQLRRADLLYLLDRLDLERALDLYRGFVS